jgi:DNA-binding NarL/FixJ family response regulator
MMPRRTFLRTAFLGAVGLAAMPGDLAPMRRPSFWIADSDPGVAFAIQLLARHCGFADAHIFECKRTAIHRLRTASTKPTLLVTDYWGWRMRGSEFIRLARDAAPATKAILFSAVVGNLQDWIDVAGVNAPRPDAIVEKPSARKLMATLCQML